MAVDPFASGMEKKKKKMQKNKKKRVPATKGFTLQMLQSSSRQGWLYQAVRGVTGQEGGQRSQPARDHL